MFTIYIFLKGVNDTGNSIVAHVHGYVPYIYASVPHTINNVNLSQYADALNLAATTHTSDFNNKIVKKIEIVQKQNIYGFENGMQSYLRIEISSPRHVKQIKKILEEGIQFPGADHQIIQTFESNLDFKIRFMADMNIVGCNWIEIAEGNYRVRNKSNYMSRSQLEIDVRHTNVMSHPADGEYIRIAPLRILSFDIECAGRKGIFPEPEHDKIIQIANMVIRNGDQEPFFRNIFTLDTCSSIQGTIVKSFKTETELLKAWSDFVREADPDIITG